MKVDSGAGKFRTLLPSRDRKGFTGTFFTAYPVQHRFMLPGDLWRESAAVLTRFQPLLSPNLTPMKLRNRWYYCSLRQLYPEMTELIVTGSTDGHFDKDEVLPTFKTVFEYINEETVGGDDFTVLKDSILNIFFGIVPGKYTLSVAKALESSPAEYWLKAYCRIWWDYYRDENFPIKFYRLDDTTKEYGIQQSDDFENFFFDIAQYVHKLPCFPILLPKDYFTGSLPWIMKGTIPTIEFENLITSFEFDASTSMDMDVVFAGNQASPAGEMDTRVVNRLDVRPDGTNIDFYTQHWDGDEFTDNTHIGTTTAKIPKGTLEDALNAGTYTGVTQGAFLDMAKLRSMGANTRVFERLARTGSRYTEYLRANFGLSPADETLQRAVYLGGFKQDILTTEIVQTAGDGDNPVGTLRGHGISYGGKSMRPYLSKEFGVLIALADVRPQIQYTQGVKREFTYKRRFDFVNPSFQHLSEQEVRKGEIYFDTDVDENEAANADKTFGFQGMYEELRRGSVMMIGDLGVNGSMQYWNQALDFAQRPELNAEFLNGRNYLADFLRPFGMADETENPIIFDFTFMNKPYRPLVRHATPGLFDHF